jgi:AraC family transcriptional regulator of adaptative response/methylated-DNA-[protein]-cysteine methyltransferase
MTQIPTELKPKYGFSSTDFGECCIVFSTEGVYALTFPESHESALYDLKHRFPQTIFEQDDVSAIKLVAQIFNNPESLHLCPIGTEFQHSVWNELKKIPKGETSTYAKVAEAIGRSKAVRAVGTAIGANPISFLIPCHRVVRSDGSLGGYRWGLAIKKKILNWEKESR